MGGVEGEAGGMGSRFLDSGRPGELRETPPGAGEEPRANAGPSPPARLAFPTRAPRARTHVRLGLVRVGVGHGVGQDGCHVTFLLMIQLRKLGTQS